MEGSTERVVGAVRRPWRVTEGPSGPRDLEGPHPVGKKLLCGKVSHQRKCSCWRDGWGERTSETTPPDIFYFCHKKATNLLYTPTSLVGGGPEEDSRRGVMVLVLRRSR